ncbi:thiamine-phosphate kinase [Methanohalophilus portucalensis]|uniref:Thiamine-monophosphate kinase n=2 Tax=Methanohalophilus portucalensis TaxID=39664 RepID=A0A1L9C5J2_9EURY|nr:thiamine-phosphate kinase [Methanohalophilus portucalensis]ATU08452.1 thiamine-phosphate kinase [Methanohalophilus portucalensis]OJH49800.1 thiamine-phosphate kinase [Methanohalophilus portucalensis FDF-1]RNI13381.1 thiamine-phosphate kinase [Methanohalophilus portucalensis FDF-1]SMH33730.1 thiamine-phosphate kinase [Methanohalophilus portucalensis FDF-1]
MVSTIKDIDERAFIAQLASVFGKGKDELKVPAGDDDCAVLEFGGEYLVVTTDMLHQKTDFPDTMTPWQIGWMSAAVNFSDIASMGGHPLGLLAAVGYPKNMSMEDAGEIARGMRDCAEFCETSVIGGDVDSHEELTITGTALGRVSKEELLTRKGAKPGDLVCVTGPLGAAGAALEAYLKNIDFDDDFMKPLLEPVPRIAEGRMLAKSGAVTSAMDTSDGLALSLYDLASVNDVGFVLREELLPVDRRVFDIASSEKEALDMALYSGGDFELLVTVSREMFDALQAESYLTVVGEIVDIDAGIILIGKDGANFAINRKGYLHIGTSEQI